MSGKYFRHTIVKTIFATALFSCAHLYGNTILAQSPIRLEVILLQPDIKVQDIIAAQNTLATYKDSVSVHFALQKLLTSLFDAGFYTASFDSVYYGEKTASAFLQTGSGYGYNILNKTETRQYSDIPLHETRLLTARQMNSYIASILQWMGKAGYPFAQVTMTNVVITQKEIQCLLKITPNEKIIIDSLIITGDAMVTKRFIEQYLLVKGGDTYDENVIQSMKYKLGKLNFVSQKRDPQLSFTESRCRINLFLDKKPASSADGILGILPPASGGGKTIVTGELKLRLLSSMRCGELLDINWKRPNNNTQNFSAMVSYPYLFHSPVGVDGKLEIYKRDTTFLDVTKSIGLNYLVGANNNVKLFVEQKSISLLSTAGYKNLTQLPDIADLKKTLFGMSLTKENVDYLFNPKKGYIVSVTIAAGNKTIEKNPAINSELYDSITLRTNEYRLQLTSDYYIKLFPKIIINTGLTGGALQSKSTFNNELYRFGGLKSLRGFDEEAFYANRYIIGKAELRFMLDARSYIFGFYNQAYYTQKTIEKNVSDIPFGFGTGLAFETKAGIFSFNYALGSQRGNPIQLRSGKVHFGVISAF